MSDGEILKKRAREGGRDRKTGGETSLCEPYAATSYLYSAVELSLSGRGSLLYIANVIAEISIVIHLA